MPATTPGGTGDNGQDNERAQAGAASATSPETTPRAIPPAELAQIERMFEVTDQIEELTPQVTPLGGVETYETPSAAAQAGIRLVVFSDGTGNSSAKAEKTNVWRMFEAVEQGTPDQLAMYDDGVGSSRNKYWAALSGAFGIGLKKNVIDLYKFLCRNYQGETTRIYCFGFSRGAFTIRVLTGLIAEEGLVTFTSEQQLQERAVAAYGRFHEKCIRATLFSPAWFLRKLRGRRPRHDAQAGHGETPSTRHGVRIEFLGLWDTVAAYGVPIEELRPAFSWFYPSKFENTKLPKIVKHACHALSLDDERMTFHPIPFDESGDEDQQRITQVWFSGVHSNVGGGYPEDQLSLVSLEWMMQHAMQAGLELRPQNVKRVSKEKSGFAKVYDSRAGLGCFYRYAPRTVPKGTGPEPVLPVVHGSVIERMAHGSDGYVPSTLPRDFLVLAPDGSLLPMRGEAAPGVAGRISKMPKRLQVPDAQAAQARTEALRKTIKALDTPDAVSLEPILNTIFWRRINYFTTLAAAMLVALFPWVAPRFHAAVESVANWDAGIGWILAAPVHVIGSFAPGAAAPWIDGVRDYPIEFIILSLALGGSFRLGTWLMTQLSDLRMLAWHAQLRTPYRTAMAGIESSRIARTLGLLLAFDGVFAALLLPPATRAIAAALWPAAAVVNVAALARVYWHRHFIAVLDDPAQPISSGLFNQLVAQRLRTNRGLQWLTEKLAKTWVPRLLGVALVGAVAALGYHFLFEVENSAGAFCQGTSGIERSPFVAGKADAAARFDTRNMCWASGLRLQHGARYRITLTDDRNDWFDASKKADFRGFEADSAIHVAATPLKHRWTERWFAPIARVDVKGNDEVALHPCAGATAEKNNVLVSEFTAKRDGELFLFVNDAVVAWPGNHHFYDNNRGSARIQVEPVRGPSPYACPD